MKHSLMYTALLSATLVMAGCGSDNDDSQPENNNPPVNNPDSGLSEAQKQKIIAVAEQTGTISLKESLLSGVVDTLLYGTDEADQDVNCTSGSYSKAGDVITFNNCNGLFKATTGLNQDQNLTASGQVTITEAGYEYQNLVLVAADGGSKTVNGLLELSDTVSTDSLKVKTIEKNGTASAEVNYTLTDYKLTYRLNSATEVALNAQGTLAAINSSVGDYSVKFETTSPLLMQRDPEEDEVIGYPYAGVLKVTNTSYGSITTLTANTDKRTVRYVVSVAEKELASGTKNWSEVLGYN